MKKTIRNIYPGEVLLEAFLLPMGISQNALARAAGVPPRRINDIVLGKRGVTADTAIRLAAALGTRGINWDTHQLGHPSTGTPINWDTQTLRPSTGGIGSVRTGEAGGGGCAPPIVNDVRANPWPDCAVSCWTPGPCWRCGWSVPVGLVRGVGSPQPVPTLRARLRATPTP
jgi:addiction module HigA family antidote